MDDLDEDRVPTDYDEPEEVEDYDGHVPLDQQDDFNDNTHADGVEV